MIVYLNGQLMPAAEARISPFDRGFTFGDGVYEVLRCCPLPAPDGAAAVRFIGEEHHTHRLRSSLAAIGIDWDASQLGSISRRLIEADGLDSAMVYVQITRGTPDLARQPARSHAAPSGLRPTVFGYARPLPPLELRHPVPAMKRCITAPDIRWQRCEIKSISLLGGVMAANAAAEAGAEEAILIREKGGRRVVSEGSYSNVALALPSGEVVTPSLDSSPMLAGITRRLLVDAAPYVAERTVDADELHEATEVMLVGTTTMVTTVTHLDGRPIGSGTPGPAARRLLTDLTNAVARGLDVPMNT